MSNILMYREKKQNEIKIYNLMKSNFYVVHCIELKTVCLNF